LFKEINDETLVLDFLIDIFSSGNLEFLFL